MKSPFKFGRVVSGDAFTNRTKELKRLKQNIKNYIHTILISPRRWGKSSLVKQTHLNWGSRDKSYKFCFIDLFKIRNEEEFYSSYARAVIKSTSSKTEEWIALTKSLLGRITPRISFGADPLNDFDISFDLTTIKGSFEDILNLPERIAEKKGYHIIVCIDEFQNLGNFDEPVLFQKRLRSVWQHHQGVTYILYGSKRHMLMELFENKSMPFYKFGDVIYLEKISLKDLTSFIISSFAQSGKEIEDGLAQEIAGHVKCHPYFTQQLAHLVWLNTEFTASREHLELALQELMDQNSILYERELESLSNIQLNFLKAVVSGVEMISSTNTIKRFKMNSSAHVSRARKALEKKELIDSKMNKTEVIDPVFELWLKRYFINR